MTPTPVSSSPPPPPPVVQPSPPAPEPEEEPVGECPAPGPDEQPESAEEDSECPCEDRFSTLDAKLESIARQLDELKGLQAQMNHA